MQAVAEHVAVVVMTLLMAWPVSLFLLALPLVLIAWRTRAGNWRDRRRRQVAGAVLACGIPIGMLLALLSVGGHPGDMGYWLDWLFLIALAAAIALYLAVLVFWALPSHTVVGPRQDANSG